MGVHIKKAIDAMLEPANNPPCKQINISLPVNFLDQLTAVAKAMTQASGSRVSRNMLICDAIEGFVAECAEQGLLPKTAVTASGYATMPDHETRHSLNASSWLFRGTKPAAVIFGGHRVPVTTWREAYTQILRRCDQEKHGELLQLRNKIAGRKRVFLSDKPDGMDAPIKIADTLYAEAYFDTEYLVRTLKHILDAAGCDYSGISIVMKEAAKESHETSRVAALCQHRIINERNLIEQPITRQELLDCMLLTAALDREHASQIKQAVTAMAFCTPETADICKRTLAELRRLPELLREDATMPTDYLDLDDRQAEMAAAWQSLRVNAAASPAQADYLNAAADIMEEWWTPFGLEE